MPEDDLNLYIITEINYKKLHSFENNIFPENWYSTKNYKLKTQIIIEALQKNIKIVETELYQNEMIENNNHH